MTTNTKNKPAFKLTVVLLALLIAGVYSCNSAATDKPATTDSTAKVSTDTVTVKVDTAAKALTDTAKLDSTKGGKKETKAPPPPPPKP